ncbi:hypothetical protein ACET3Z_028651 [Daucus carota]
MGMSILPPDLHHLGLSSCNLKEFPHLSGETRFFSFSHIDLSNNQIDSEIPHWIGLQSWQENSYLNLSHNRLTGKPKWFAGIIARELGLKIRRMEIKWR